MLKSLLLLFMSFALISGLALQPNFVRLMKKYSRVSTNGRIVGGSDTDIERHPWQAAMFDSDFYYCGGVIINERRVITAAHCLEDDPPESFITFRVGTTLRGEGGQEYGIVSYELHPQYDEYMLSFDIAMAQLDGTLSFGASIQPAALVEVNFEPGDGTDATVTGWGYTDEGTLPHVLQEVTIPIVLRSRCAEIWDPWDVDETMICAGISEKDSCGGDSGGPLMQDGKLIGLVSWGPEACGDGFPGVYTKISHPGIISWIQG